MSSEAPTREAATAATSPDRLSLVYFNGFELNGTLSDFGIVLMYDGQPQVKLALSFTTAKSLLRNLEQAVESFETLTKQQLLTMDDVSTALEAKQK
jgi:hypothetical protein